MPRFYLNFDVNGVTQTITATNKRPLRAGSKNYWYANFNFLDNSFDNLEHLSASFSTKPYSPSRSQAIIMPIVNNQAQIPWEMMTRKRKFYIGVSAGDMLVTNEEVLEVTEAAPTGGIYSEPTSSWYTEYTNLLNQKQDKLVAGDNIQIDKDNNISVENAVLYKEQSLTDEEKVQARENINAGTEEVLNIEAIFRREYQLLISYEDFINAVDKGDTIWITLPYKGRMITLKDHYRESSSFIFWGVCPPNAQYAEESAGHLIAIYFDIDENEHAFGTIRSEDYELDIFSHSVDYEVQQNLSDGQKLLARENIGAGTEDVYTAEFFCTLSHSGTYIASLTSSYEEYLDAVSKNKTLWANITIERDNGIYLKNHYEFDGAEMYYGVVPIAEGAPCAIYILSSLHMSGGTLVGILTLINIPGAQEVEEELQTKSDKILQTVIQGSSGQVINASLDGNKTYWIVDATSQVNINLNRYEKDDDFIYHFYIQVGDNPISIVFPVDVGYAPGAVNALTKTNTVIEVSITNIPSIVINNITYNYLAYANYMEFNPWD